MVRGAWVAGVLLIAVMVTGCLADGGSPNASGVRVIELTMVEPFGYDPSVVEVRQGETVHFVVRNPTPIAHEMYIGSGSNRAQARQSTEAPPRRPAPHIWGTASSSSPAERARSTTRSVVQGTS